MSSIKIILLIVMAFAGLTSCGQFKAEYQDVDIASAQESSCGFILNSKGYRVSWRTQIPTVFWLEKNVPEKYRDAIKAAADQWNKATGRNLLAIAEERVDSDGSRADGKNIIYWVTAEGVFSNPNEQAKTSARWTDNNLNDTDIIINAKNWMFFIDVPEPSTLHLGSLMVHEFGHALGLVHQNLFISVMYPTLRTSYIRDEPQEKPDISDIGCEYL